MFLADLTPQAAVAFAVAVFAVSLVPWFLLVDAEHLTPSWLRDPAVLKRLALALLKARAWVRHVAVAALLVAVCHLTPVPKGAHR